MFICQLFNIYLTNHNNYGTIPKVTHLLCSFKNKKKAQTTPSFTLDLVWIICHVAVLRLAMERDLWHQTWLPLSQSSSLLLANDYLSSQRDLNQHFLQILFYFEIQSKSRLIIHLGGKWKIKTEKEPDFLHRNWKERHVETILQKSLATGYLFSSRHCENTRTVKHKNSNRTSFCISMSKSRESSKAGTQKYLTLHPQP